MLLSAVMMLRHLNLNEYADKISNAVHCTIEAGKVSVCYFYIKSHCYLTCCNRWEPRILVVITPLKNSLLLLLPICKYHLFDNKVFFNTMTIYLLHASRCDIQSPILLSFCWIIIIEFGKRVICPLEIWQGTQQETFLTTTCLCEHGTRSLFAFAAFLFSREPSRDICPKVGPCSCVLLMLVMSGSGSGSVCTAIHTETRWQEEHGQPSKCEY